MPNSFPCQLKICSESGGVAPSSDVTLYNLQDAIAFNSEDVSILVECLEGYYWPVGSCPQVITYRAGRFTIPIPPTTGGFPIVIQLQGCLSLVSITLPAGSTTAAIQAAANTVILQVAAQQAQCDAINPPVDDPNDPDGPGGGGPNPLPRFFNQVMYYSCASGAVISLNGSPSWVSFDAVNNRLVVRSGVFGGDTQAAANLTAQTLLNHAHICIGSLSITNGCLGEAFSTQVSISSEGGASRASFEIVSGVLPPGLNPSQSFSTAFFSGTPTVAGEYVFTLRATDVDLGLFYTDKAFTVKIVSIDSPSALPDAACGTPYSYQLLRSGPADGTVNWEQLSGILPSGLTLSSSGLLSGNPVCDGDYSFVIGVSDNTSVCTKAFTLYLPPDDGCIETDSQLPQATASSPYSVILDPAFDPDPGMQFIFTLVSGALPSGLTLTTAGEISGTVTQTTAFNAEFCIRITQVPI